MIIPVYKKGLEYDIHAIAKAFYPHEDIRVDFCGDENDDGVSKEEKSRIVNEFYDSLCLKTGKTLPWGSLTGVRPTKIARMMLDEGKEDDAIREHYLKDRRVSKEKAELAIGIAHLERQLVSPISDGKGFSLYIDIPFCPTRCAYCSFTAYPLSGNQANKEEYLKTLYKEIDAVSKMATDKAAIEGAYRLDTIYIGGGTPTSLEPNELDALLTKICENFDLSSLKEFTVEAGRPDSITKEKLLAIKKHPVTRISVNPQTMNDKTLRLIGRNHTVSQYVDAFNLARQCGFDNINTDIILGLPEETPEDVKRTVEEISCLSPDSLTVHTLAEKRASRMRIEKLAAALKAQKSGPENNSVNIIANSDCETLEDSDNVVDIKLEQMMRYASEAAIKMGMKPYYLYRQKNMSGNLENTGFSKDGKFGLYNILIMEEIEDIIALGCGGISKRLFFEESPGIRIERCENVKDLKNYIERIDEMIDRKTALFIDQGSTD